MGVIKQGILGGFSNKVGAVVGSSWKGIAVMKSKPISVANPKTAGQVAQRTKMKTITQFLSPILADIIKPLNDRFAVKQSGFNIVTSRNLQWVSDSGDIAYPNFQLSQGKLSTPSITSVDASAGSNLITVDWNNTLSNQYDLENDVVYVSVYDSTALEWVGIDSSASRVDGTVEIIPLKELTPANVLRLYVSFRRTDGTYVSNSAYISTNVLA